MKTLQANPRPMTAVRQAASAALLLCAACGRQSAPQNPPPPVRFSFQNRIGSAVPILAVAKNLFETHGVTVEAKRFDNGPACSEALFTGSADIGSMGDTTAIIALARNPSLRIIACEASGEHRHRLIVKEQSPLNSARDLVGRRIAVKRGTSTYGGLLSYLSANGLSPAQVTLVPLDPSSMPEALASGSIDAFAASEPTPSLGELRGGRELATFGGLGNTYPIMLLATERFVTERPDDLRKFLAALREAAALLATDKPAAAAEVAKATGLPPAVAERAMARHTYRVEVDDATLESLRQIAVFLKEQGIIKSVPPLRAPDERK